MIPLLVDTSIFVAFQRGVSRELEDILQAQIREEVTVYIPSIVYFEFFYGVKSARDQKLARQIFEETEFISDTEETGVVAGKIASNYQIGFADSFIAAICLENDFHLATLNNKHFKLVPKLKLWGK